MTQNEAIEIIKEVKNNHPEAWKKLADKCNWEHKTSIYVVMNWGDPRNWD